MIKYRDAQTVNDMDFVRSSWSASYKNAHHAGIIDADDWPLVMHATIGKLVARPTTRTIVACGRRDFIFGFICGDVAHEMPVVHYCYVKGAHRSQEIEDGSRSGPRIARGLFAALGVDPTAPFLYTCKTAVVVQMIDKIPLARFTPAAARYPNYHEHNRSESAHEQRDPEAGREADGRGAAAR